MTQSLPFKSVIRTTIAVGALCAGAGAARAATYLQTDLVSDISGLGQVTDSNLKNPWGLSFLPGSPVWISDQGTNNATLYGVTGSTVAKNQLTVAIPGAGGPTGQVANTNTAAFNVGNGGGHALFIFGNLNGSISAWNPAAGAPNGTAVPEWTTPGASYTGLAINQANTTLYAANDAGAGGIDVFNSAFAPMALSAGAFATPTAIVSAGLVPFNVKDIGGNVFVTYAPSGHIPQTKATPGQGAVAEFSESGTFEGMSSASADSKLASPWGIALAPSNWGQFGGDLLVGNFAFGDSVIDAFNPTTWAFEGSIDVNPGAGNTPGGLWSLAFGGGGADGNPNTLFFTDGINGETDGLFGSITAVPESSTWAMMLVGFGGLALFAARRRASLAIG